MDNEIRKENRIAGSCDQYTRPEEIKALSKYLKTIKKSYEDNTSLETDNIGIKGFGDNATIKEINSLSDIVQKLSPGISDPTLVNQVEKLIKGAKDIELVEGSEKIVGTTDQDLGLITDTEKISGGVKNIRTLPQELEKLGGKTEIVDELGGGNPKKISGVLKDTKGLERLREQVLGDPGDVGELSNKKETRIGDDKSINGLVKTEENIIGDPREISELESGKIKIDNSSVDVSELSSFLQRIEDIDDDNKLGSGNEKLVGIKKDLELSEKIERISETNTIDSLENRSEKIGGIAEDISLRTDIEKLSDVGNGVDLSTSRETLEGTVGELELLRKVEDIPNVPRDVKLVADNERLPGNEVDLESLEKDVEKRIGNVKEPKSLSNDREGLVGKRVDISSLSKESEKLEVKESIALSDKSAKISGVSSEVSGLEDYLENIIPDSPEVDLEDSQVKIGGPVQDRSLSDVLIELSPIPNNDISLYAGINSDKTLKYNNSTNELSELSDDIEKAAENQNLHDVELGQGIHEENKVIAFTENNFLEDYRDDIVVPSDNTLEDEKLEIEGEQKDSSLEDERLEIEGEGKDINLEDEKLEIEGEQKDSSLEDERLEIEGEGKDIALSDTLEKRLSDVEGEDRQEFDPGNDSLYDSVIGVGDDRSDTPFSDKLVDAKEDLIRIEEDKDVELEGNTESLIGTQKEQELRPDLDHLKSDMGQKMDVEEIIKLRNTSVDAYYSGILHFADSKTGMNSGWAGKVSSLMSTYLSSNPSKQQAEEFLTQLHKSVIDDKYVEKMMQEKAMEVDLGGDKENVSKMKLPSFNVKSLNLNNYLRWTAENTVSNIHGAGKLRTLLLDETLASLVVARRLLEKSTKSNRDRLPGDDAGLLSAAVSGGVSGVFQNIGKTAANAVYSTMSGSSVNMSQPQNRPKEETKGFTKLNNIGLDYVVGGSSSSSGGFWDTVKKLASNFAKSALGKNSSPIDYDFVNNYISNADGVLKTLEELTGTNEKPDSVESLMKIMRNSANITTADNYTSTDRGHKISTIDSNNYWEVVLYPYVKSGVNGNGGYSYLPPIDEINYWNRKQHGYDTKYNTYIPITGFELQKSRLSSKTLPLYDGEISYPVSMEYSNEFRITIADDQYKSWRNYFERCSEVSVYSSKSHSASDYEKAVSSPTKVDKNFICIAPYKNITFRCMIYCMTPQYSTINKYDLLLVLKEFSEDRSGEIDSGGGDLTVSFSIVGENPDTSGKALPKVNQLYVEKRAQKNRASWVSSIVKSGVNNIIGLI